jgi:hypothetical protein
MVQVRAEDPLRHGYRHGPRLGIQHGHTALIEPEWSLNGA